MIECRNLDKVFKNGERTDEVLKNLNLAVKENEFLVIMGESGSGKSTLLHSLSGMDVITDGEVLFDGERLDKYSEKKMKNIRLKHFGFVFQEMNLVDILTLEENIALPAYENKTYQSSRVEELLYKFGIENCARKFPNKVSGGERQRAAIARAIVNSPEVLFVDEPTGSLDHANSIIIMDYLKQLHCEGQTIIMVTHDKLCASYGSRVVYLKNKSIQSEIICPKNDELDQFLKDNEW